MDESIAATVTESDRKSPKVAREQLWSEACGHLGANALRSSRATLICLALLVCLVLPDADAKTPRYRKTDGILSGLAAVFTCSLWVHRCRCSGWFYRAANFASDRDNADQGGVLRTARDRSSKVLARSKRGTMIRIRMARIRSKSKITSRSRIRAQAADRTTGRSTDGRW